MKTFLELEKILLRAFKLRNFPSNKLETPSPPGTLNKPKLNCACISLLITTLKTINILLLAGISKVTSNFIKTNVDELVTYS